MRPSEIRRSVLTDHERLRADLDRLEFLAREVLRGRRASAETLRSDSEALLVQLGSHMRWEERYLLPALRDADAWGAERAEQLIRDHHEQRQLLAFILERLRDHRRRASLVARDVASLIELLRDDMREEERDLLDPRVLRDDVVGIAVETG